ncbi:hypothetical protein G3578_20470 [Brevibacillus sp. SYP-B805]|uniref:CdaR family protein n=1 Tax=Brevibacillus sp. SYP-B805 TaxID=1578199 RepID=UPI0013EA5EF5|nr:CdaR family protein [Brevibacillus sp. SYP-B805]NGQ97513.1 hypothetical protein [Brevibacillus sp. SYP-B805]
MDKWLNSHWFARAIALLMAAMLWMVVNMESEPGMTTDVSQPVFIDGVTLHVYYDTDRYHLVKQPKTVKVALESSNPFYRHNFVPPDSYEVYVDATNLGKGTHKVPVLYKGFPEEARVGIIPNVVEITLEEKKTVEKEVKVDLLGQVAPGYTAGEPIVKPFRALVRVPESQVNNIAVVKASVDLEGATETIKKTVSLKAVDKSGNVIQGVEINPLTVEVNIPVTSPFATVPLKLNLTNELPDGYSLADVEMNTEEVTVYGPKEVIDAINTYPGPEIDLSKVTGNQFFQLKIPYLENVVRVEPEDLQVTLKVVPSATKRLQHVPIRVTGLPANTQARVLDANGKEISTLDFDVVGAPQILNKLTVEDVQVVADVTNLPVGVHEVTLNYNYNMPHYLKTAANATKQVTVEITKTQR